MTCTDCSVVMNSKFVWQTLMTIITRNANTLHVACTPINPYYFRSSPNRTELRSLVGRASPISSETELIVGGGAPSVRTEKSEFFVPFGSDISTPNGSGRSELIGARKFY
jgi:hypothetical protein